MTRLISLALLLACGCADGVVASGVPVECHGVNWYQEGRRDAMLDNGRDNSARNAGCGNAFDAARYREGFADGQSQRAKSK